MQGFPVAHALACGVWSAKIPRPAITNPRKLKHALLEPALLHHITDPAGHLSRAGIEDAQIIPAGSFGAER